MRPTGENIDFSFSFEHSYCLSSLRPFRNFRDTVMPHLQPAL